MTFISNIPWKEGRTTQTLVIHCSAYDFRPYFQEFITDGLKLTEYDVLAIPGGIQVLTLAYFLPKLESTVKKMISFLVEKHDLKRIILVGHHDCGWYKDFRFGPVHIDLAKRQLDDLKTVAKQLREVHGLAIEAYYGDVTDKTGVVNFDIVSLA